MAVEYRKDMSQFRAIVLIAVDDSEPAEFAFNFDEKVGIFCGTLYEGFSTEDLLHGVGYRDYIHKPEYFTILLHCTDQNDQEIRDASPGRTAKIVKELAEEMKRIEDKFGHLMEINGIKGKIRKGSGKPGEAIVKAAADEGATMIVTGTRGLSKLKRAFLGSVSDYVVHNSPVPVITCRRH